MDLSKFRESLASTAQSISSSAEALIFDNASGSGEQRKPQTATNSPVLEGRKGSNVTASSIPAGFLGIRLPVGQPSSSDGDRSTAAPRAGSILRSVSSAKVSTREQVQGTGGTALPAGMRSNTPSVARDTGGSSMDVVSAGGGDDLASLAGKLSKRCAVLDKRVILLRAAVGAALDRIEEADEVVQGVTGKGLSSYLVQDSSSEGSSEGVGVSSAVRSELGTLGLLRAVVGSVGRAADSVLGLGEEEQPLPPYIGYKLDKDRLQRAVLAQGVLQAQAALGLGGTGGAGERDKEEGASTSIWGSLGEGSKEAPANLPPSLTSLPTVSKLEDEVVHLQSREVAQAATIARLQAELSSVRKEGHAATAARHAAVEDARRAAASLATAQESIESLQSECAAAVASAEVWRTEAQAGSKEVQGLREEVAMHRARAGEAAATIAALTSRVAELQQKLTELQVSVPSAPVVHAAAMAEVQLTSLRQQHGQLERRHRDLAAGHAELQEAYAELMKEIAASRAAAGVRDGGREPGSVHRRGMTGSRLTRSSSAVSSEAGEGGATPEVHPVDTALPTLLSPSSPVALAPSLSSSSLELVVPASEATSLGVEVAALTSALDALRQEHEDTVTQLALARQQEAVLKGEVRVLQGRVDTLHSLTCVGPASSTSSQGGHGGSPSRGAGQGPPGVAFAYLRNVCMQYIGFANDPGAASQRRALALVLATLLDFDDTERKKLGLPLMPSGHGPHGMASPAARPAQAVGRQRAPPASPPAVRAPVPPVPVPMTGHEAGGRMAAVPLTPAGKQAREQVSIPATGGATWSGVV